MLGGWVGWGFLPWLPAGLSQWVMGGVCLAAWGSRLLSCDPEGDSCPGSQEGSFPGLLGQVAGSAPAGPVHF